jgi:hypothetical protein
MDPCRLWLIILFRVLLEPLRHILIPMFHSIIGLGWEALLWEDLWEWGSRARIDDVELANCVLEKRDMLLRTE